MGTLVVVMRDLMRLYAGWLPALLLGASCLLAGCSGGSVVAPLGRSPDSSSTPTTGVHRVVSGDTLFSIAWRYGLDHRDLARWNAIPEPYTIYPGQRLKTSRPSVVPPMPAPAAPAATPRSTPPAAASRREQRAATRPARARPVTPPPGNEPPVRAWRWPARGTIVGTFAREGGKGIDIAGRAGAPVVAAAGGRVVYSGSGLRGYGKLIIVKHNKRYLSAYAHNDRLHVKEGDTVTSGQRIADMGSTDAQRVKLHFEIRRDGKPVDPTRYLPR